jgi:hypothetical protein
MAFRIGINLGDVMLHGGDLYGEGVNVAARLEALAEPGGICISRTVYDQVRNKLTIGFEDMGDQAVKNISEPVQAFRVRLDGAARDSRRPPASAPPPASDGWAASDRDWRIRRLRQRAIRAGFLIALLCVINLVTSSGYLWFLWPTLFIGAFLAWDALKVYYPDLAGGAEQGWQKIGGDVTFSKDTRFRGKIGGNAVVGRGVHVELSGKVGGDLIIEEDAIADVRGKIAGNVRNRGGTLRLSGKLSGKVEDEDPGLSEARPLPRGRPGRRTD